MARLVRPAGPAHGFLRVKPALDLNEAASLRRA